MVKHFSYIRCVLPYLCRDIYRKLCNFVKGNNEIKKIYGNSLIIIGENPNILLHWKNNIWKYM